VSSELSWLNLFKKIKHPISSVSLGFGGCRAGICGMCQDYDNYSLIKDFNWLQFAIPELGSTSFYAIR
jgi:hypothetical protein